MADGPVSPEGGTQGPVSGQPTPEGAVPPQQGGFLPKVDEWAQKAQAAEPTRQALSGQTGTPPSAEAAWSIAQGLYEKPTKTDFDPATQEYFRRLREVFARTEKSLAKLTPAEREELAGGVTEVSKAAHGVDDTAELEPKTRMSVQATYDWLRGKMIK